MRNDASDGFLYCIVPVHLADVVDFVGGEVLAASDEPPEDAFILVGGVGPETLMIISAVENAFAADVVDDREGEVSEWPVECEDPYVFSAWERADAFADGCAVIFEVVVPEVKKYEQSCENEFVNFWFVPVCEYNLV